MSQLRRPGLERLIATAPQKKERIRQDRCVNYHCDGGNDAVPAPSVFSLFPQWREGGMEVEQGGRSEEKEVVA